jgi:hypothetical protein
MQNLGTLQQFLNFSPQICESAGGWGVPKFFFIGILIFMLLRSPCKNLKPYDNPFWGFEQRWREEKKIDLPKIVAYLSLLCWSHGLRSDENSGLAKFLCWSQALRSNQDGKMASFRKLAKAG